MLSKLVAALALAGAIQPALGLTAEQWKGKTIYQWVSSPSSRPVRLTGVSGSARYTLADNRAQTHHRPIRPCIGHGTSTNKPDSNGVQPNRPDVSGIAASQQLAPSP